MLVHCSLLVLTGYPATLIVWVLVWVHVSGLLEQMEVCYQRIARWR
jgi:hypothetical protein